MTTCPACGNTGGTNDQFCGSCGSQLAEGEQQFSQIIEDNPEQEVVTTCDSCGAGMTVGQSFCTVCGQK
jgi:RNase P subunit RPR2